MKKHLFIIALSMSVTLASYADSNIRHGDVLYTSTDMKTCTVDGVITGTYGKVVIPESFDFTPILDPSHTYHLTVVGVSADGFSDGGNATIEEVVLPESVTQIGHGAFKNCTALKSINIPSKVTELERSFNYCKSLRRITIPATVLSVEGSFAYCDTIEELIIADGGTSLYLNTNQVGVFSNTSIKKIYQGRNITSTNSGGFNFTEKGIADLIIGDMVTEIGNKAYYGNPIENISFGKGLAKIGNSAFQYCDRLTSIELPESLAELGLYAFNNCAMLSHIKIGSKLAELDNNFNYCKSIQTVTIPATIQTVAGSFAYCDTIEELIIADGGTSLYLNTNQVGVFSNTSIKKIYQGRDITSTNNNGFKFTKKGIADLVVGDMVTEIGKEAYNDNPIENISFGKGLAKIGDSAFLACNNIKTITTYAVAVPECASSSVFTQNTYDSTWLLVPTGSRKLYSEASVWKLFKNVGQSTCAVTFEYDNKQCNVIVPESFEGIVDFGTSITFSATPNDGFKISSITADGEYGSLKADADGVWKLDSIRSDVTVKISSGELTYSVSAKIDPEAGRITINNEKVDSAIITWNQNVTIGILLNEGYRIEAADANGVDVTDKITDNHLSIESIRENVTVVFTTALKSFRFKSEYDNTHGTVSVNGNTSDEQILSYGNCAKIEIIPDEGYCVAWAYLNGRDILKELKDNQYITDPIKENTTLNVGFETRVILLSVLGIEGGRVANIYDYGMSARVRVIPDENWHINSVVFNGSPIAFDEVSESIFTTPALTDDSEISVTFEKNDISSLSNNAIADIKVYGYNHTVMILNAPEDEPAYITDTNGRTIYSGIEREITVNDSGIYLVTIGTRTFKLML